MEVIKFILLALVVGSLVIAIPIVGGILGAVLGPAIGIILLTAAAYAVMKDLKQGDDDVESKD